METTAISFSERLNNEQKGEPGKTFSFFEDLNFNRNGELKKTFSFGKIAFYGKKKINKVTVEMRIYKDAHLSICGEIWNSTGNDCVSCGQNLDTINEYLKKDLLFKILYRLWTLYHLKDIADIPENDLYLIKTLLTTDCD